MAKHEQTWDMSPSGQTPPKGTQDVSSASHWAPTHKLYQPKGTTSCSVVEEYAPREPHRYLLKNGFLSNLEERESAGIKPQACNWEGAGRGEGSWVQHPSLANPWPPHILPVQQGGEHSPFSMGMGQMNASEPTKRFLLVVLAGTTYVSWMVPWKAMTQAGAARLPLCSRASRCHPLCLPPSPAATAEHGTAGAKNNEPPSRAAGAVPVLQPCSAPCVFPVDLRISAMLFISCSIINQTQSLAALNEQPVSSAPTATSPLPSHLPCFIARRNTGACIQSLLIIAARGAFQMISSHRESRYSSCQTGRKRGISIQVNASFLPVIPPATWLKSYSCSEIKYLAVLCFLTSSCPCHPGL